MKNFRNPSLVLLSCLMWACGNGGNGTNGNNLPAGTNQAPTVTLKALEQYNGYVAGDTKISVAVRDDSTTSITSVKYSIDGGAEQNLAVKADQTVTLSGLAANAQTLTVTAKDSGNLSGTGTLSLKVDATAPSIVNALTKTNQTSSKASYSVTFGDVETKIISAVLLIDGKEVAGSRKAGDPTAANSTFNFDLDTTSLATGNYNVTVQAMNGVGVTTTTPATTLTIDKVIPTVAWVYPQNSYYVSKTITLQANSSKLGSTMSYTIDNNLIQDSDPATAGVQVDTTALLPGGHTLIATAKDAYGNEGSQSISISVDNTPPTAILLPVNNGNTITVNPVTINVQAQDGQTSAGIDNILVEYSIDNGLNWFAIDRVYAASGAVTWLPANGTYKLRATAYDKAGNASVPQVSGTPIKVVLTANDTTVPTTSFVSMPINQRGTVTINVNANDVNPTPNPNNEAPTGVQKVELYDGNNLIATQTSSLNKVFAFVVNTASLSEGSHTFKAVAIDGNGNRSVPTSVLPMVVDNVAPVVSWSSPKDGADLKLGSYNLSTLVTEANLASLTYALDGVPLAGSVLDTTNVSDGKHTLTATVVDNAGNSTSSSITVTVDKFSPVINLSGVPVAAPFSAADTTPVSVYTTNPATFSVLVDDQVGSGVKEIRATAGTTLLGIITNANTANFSWSAPNTQHVPVTVTVTDNAGNVSTKTFEAAVDTSVPTVTWNTPKDGADLNTTTVTLDANAQDNNLKSLVYKVDGSIQASPANLLEGKHVLEAIATDYAGNTASATSNIIIDTTAPNVDMPGLALNANGEVVFNIALPVVNVVASDGSGAGIAKIEARLQGASLGTQTNVESANFTLQGLDSTLRDLLVTVTDKAGNQTSRTIKVSYQNSAITQGAKLSLSASAVNPTPQLKSDCSTANPGTLSCVSGNINVPVGVEEQTPGATTVVSLQLAWVVNGLSNKITLPTTVAAAPYGFSLNTTDFPNGTQLTITATGRTTANTQTVDAIVSNSINLTVFNANAVVAPVIKISSPSTGDVLGGLSPVTGVITPTSDYQVGGVTVQVDVLDYRGNLVLSGTAVTAVDGTYTTPNFDFSSTKIPADEYTIRARATVTGITIPGSSKVLETSAKISTKNDSLNPPAVNVRIPVRISGYQDTAYDLTDLAKTGASYQGIAVLNRKSGLVLEASDDSGLKYVQVRVINEDGTPTNAYLLNTPVVAVSSTGQAVTAANYVVPGLELDGTQYVADGYYILRITVEDSSGLRNIQEIKVRVDRSQKDILDAGNNPYQNFGGVCDLPSSAQGKPSCLAASWTLGTPLKNDARATYIYYVKGEQTALRTDTYIPAGQTPGVGIGITEAGVYRVDTVVEDLVTGVVRYYVGADVPVIINP